MSSTSLSVYGQFVTWDKFLVHLKERYGVGKLEFQLLQKLENTVGAFTNGDVAYGMGIFSSPWLSAKLDFLVASGLLYKVNEIAYRTVKERQAKDSGRQTTLFPQRSHRLALIVALGNRCAKCGSIEDLQIDHKIPLSQGGADAFENMQDLCEDCHKQKTREERRRW